MTEDMNRFGFNTEGKICDYGYEEQKVLTEQEILEELNRLNQTNYELMSECTSVNWTNECLQEELDKAIVPKFKIWQKVWFIDDINEETHSGIIVGFEVSKVYDSQLEVYYRIEYEDGCLITDDFEDKLVFATEEEARAKLKELQSE